SRLRLARLSGMGAAKLTYSGAARDGWTAPKTAISPRISRTFCIFSVPPRSNTRWKITSPETAINIQPQKLIVQQLAIFNGFVCSYPDNFEGPSVAIGSLFSAQNHVEDHS